MRRVALLGLLACASCTWDGGVPDVVYSCPDGRCPDGQRCSDDGVCVADVAAGSCGAGEARFADEFDDTLDPTAWEVEADGDARAEASGGRLEVTYGAPGTAAEARMLDRALLEGATFTVEVIPPPDLSSSFIRLRLTDEGAEPLELRTDTFDLIATIDSDQDVPEVVFEGAYEPQAHRFWRIRWADEICFSASPDGDDFEELGCGAGDGVRTMLRAGLGAGNYAGDGQTAAFDHLTWCGGP
jgi:hypothetical protein